MAKKQAIVNDTAASATSARAAKPKTPRVKAAQHKVVSPEAVSTEAVSSQPVSTEAISNEPVIGQAPVAANPREVIAEMAYSYWEAGGRKHGAALEDWVRAEDEYRQRVAGSRL